MTSRSVVVVTAGLSQPSSTRLLGDQLAAATVAALGEPAEMRVVEVRDLAHQLVDNALTGFPGTELREALEAVAAADAVIAVSPIFNASYSGLFKAFFDVLEPGALTGKPVLVAATGGSERHSLALEHAMRPLFAYLRAVVVPTAVYAASSDWASAGRQRLTARVERAAGELAALVAGRPAAAKAEDPFHSPTPFADLLAG
jgi:FMN reductase